MLLRLFCDVVYATDVGGIPTAGGAIVMCRVHTKLVGGNVKKLIIP
jgi:hypothetical protein